jgi:hypothetical protein
MLLRMAAVRRVDESVQVGAKLANVSLPNAPLRSRLSKRPRSEPRPLGSVRSTGEPGNRPGSPIEAERRINQMIRVLIKAVVVLSDGMAVRTDHGTDLVDA